MSLSVITLNCEGHKHLDKVVSFLQGQRADVVCMQEVFAVDVDVFAQAAAATAFFVPNMIIDKENQYYIDPLGQVGIALFSVLPIKRQKFTYYVGNDLPLPNFDNQPNASKRSVQWMTVEKDEQSYTIANTHFTWSPNGVTTDLQRQHFVQLEKILDQIDNLALLCGDFNAPRGSDIYTSLSEKYKDNIPATVHSTLDPQLHRAKKELVVDGFFTGKNYQAENVRVVCGVSDHCAVRGNISLV